ncbi:hypothetical protein CDAR_296491 [Caerostris darwini]|uniref:Uncharacterized protein n=1 Tax=Caerostris darwini TaxID=1538125 RepID=A0AAV4PIZ5_9ARAC|nr:hypothetical protein CDAR_296491 [Caerostris darwini]
MRISIRLHPCRSGTDLGLPVRCTLGIGAWDDSLAGLSHNQAARESGWKARLDAITRKNQDFHGSWEGFGEDGLRDYYFRMERCFTWV